MSNNLDTAIYPGARVPRDDGRFYVPLNRGRIRVNDQRSTVVARVASDAFDTVEEAEVYAAGMAERFNLFTAQPADIIAKRVGMLNQFWNALKALEAEPGVPWATRAADAVGMAFGARNPTAEHMAIGYAMAVREITAGAGFWSKDPTERGRLNLITRTMDIVDWLLKAKTMAELEQLTLVVNDTAGEYEKAFA